MNKLILGVILTLTTYTAQANSYFGVGVATNGNGNGNRICNNGELTLGTKLSNGYGPQIRLQGFNGGICTSNSTKVAVDFRKDISLGSGFIGNGFVGLETDENLDDVNFVGGAGINKHMSNSSMVGITLKNSYNNVNESVIYYGAAYTYVF